MSDPTSPLSLVPASQFTIEQLVQAYNQSRVDYVVPMPMNVARLADYIQTYDVQLDHSFVAMDGPRMAGIAMLGVRAGRTWITRLGVLPDGRRRGVGSALMTALLESTQRLGIDYTMLEVIKHNDPARQLFERCGFVPTRELLVIRRPPGALQPPSDSTATWLDRATVLDHLAAHQELQAWTNQTESMRNADQIMGLQVHLGDGSHGWLVFQRQRLILARLMLFTTVGEPVAVGSALLAHLYQAYPELDTQTENIAVSDPHLPALWEAGYIESFRRIEMERRFGPDAPAVSVL